MSDQDRGQGLGRSGSTSSSHRQLLPRDYSEEAQRGVRVEPQSESKKGTTSRQRVACANCQKRKSKCDGNQPCGRCASASQTCVYESDVGVPRTQALKRKNEALHEDNSQLKYIVQGLRYGSAEEATEILRRIRNTQNAEEAVVAISEASLLVKPSWADLPAFGPLQPGQMLPHSAAEILSSSSGLSRSRSDARPATSGGPRSATTANSSSPTTVRGRGLRDLTGSLMEPLGGRTSEAPLSDFIYRIQRSNDRRSSSSSSSTTQSRPTMRWTPWPPSATTREAAGTSNPLGIADRLNQLCDGFPFIDPSTSVPPDNAVLYLWNINTPAHAWTTVTDDAELVADLCTQFFMWEQPFYNYINRSAFLEDMCSVGAGPDSEPETWTREFCSPCLVNAICALGSMSSRHPGAFKYPGDLRSRGHHFIEEAERLIRLEEQNTPRLSTMQAIWMVMWFRGAAGQRFLTSEFSERFYWMYDQLQLGKAFTRPKEYDYNPRAKLYWDALSEAIWGFYCQDTLHSIANGGPARMKRPLIEKTFGRHSRTAIKIVDLWWPVPDPQRTENSLIEETLDYKCDLTDITRKMLAFVNSIQEKVRSNELGMEVFWEAYDLYDEFVHWKETIPDAFAPGGSYLPHVLLLQASYDLAIITLFRPLQQMTPDPAAFITQSRGHKHREVLHPRTYVVTHSMNILGLMNNFRNRWTFYRHCYTSQCHWLPAFALLFYLRQGEASTDTFTSAVRGLREIGQKWNVAIWMLQSIKGLADKFDVALPPRAGKYFKDLEFEAPRRGPDATDVMIPVTIPAEYRSQDSGLFPFPDSKEVGTYVQNLDSVLDQMGVVNLAMPN